MKKYTDIETYFTDQENGQELLLAIRKLLQETELVETLKWSAPCYTLKNKNVIGLAAFKKHVALWFHQGCFLKDEHNMLQNAQEGKTKALRQWRFDIDKDFDKNLVLKYIKESIENEKAGKRLKAQKTTQVDIPIELNQKLEENSKLKKAFEALTMSKRKEYAEHIASAKRVTTKESRLLKIIPMILEGKGLHDKYKSC